MLPLFLDLTDRLVLVVGGGPVGRRKARAARQAGAWVRLVCLEPRPASESDEGIEWRNESYQEAHLQDVVLVFACASTEVNRQVVEQARQRKIWVNRADAAEQGDFHLPATVRRGKLILALSTGGAAPALARALRQRLEEQMDLLYTEWVNLLADLRPMLREHLDSSKRRKVGQQLAEESWLQRLRREGPEQVRQAMQELLRACLATEQSCDTLREGQEPNRG